MNSPVKTTVSSPAASSTDSFFGMALAQVFMGHVFGEGLNDLWDAGEIASAIHEDRFEAKRTNHRVYDLGVRLSLAGDFTRISMGEPKPTQWRELTARWMTPAPRPALAA